MTYLTSSDIQGISNYILNGAKNIIVMTGAGISVSAGIPDFRTPGTGLYSQLKSYNLPNPEAIFSLDFFKENPKPFYKLAKEIYPGNHKPTPTHYFLKLLAEKGLLLRIVTQNIDSLETMAGIDPSLVVAAHGNFDTATCIKTGEKICSKEVKKAILLGERGWKAMNKKYGGLVKPDIVFFGENLPKSFVECVKNDFPKCDLLIVMGTSLKVQPFASLINKVGKNVPRLLINKEVVGRNGIEFRIGGFNFKKNFKDVLCLNECDEGVKQLAKQLDWLEQLEKLL